MDETLTTKHSIKMAGTLGQLKTYHSEKQKNSTYEQAYIKEKTFPVPILDSHNRQLQNCHVQFLLSL